MTMIFKWILTLTSNSTTFPYLMLLLYLLYSLFKVYHPIHLFLLSADDFVFSFIKNMAAFNKHSFISHDSLHPSALCLYPYILISVLNEWALLLLSKASLSICVLVPVPFFKAVAPVIPFLYCIICFPLLTGLATAAAVFRSHWKSCLDCLHFLNLFFPHDHSTWVHVHAQNWNPFVKVTDDFIIVKNLSLSKSYHCQNQIWFSLAQDVFAIMKPSWNFFTWLQESHILLIFLSDLAIYCLSVSFVVSSLSFWPMFMLLCPFFNYLCNPSLDSLIQVCVWIKYTSFLKIPHISLQSTFDPELLACVVIAPFDSSFTRHNWSLDPCILSPFLQCSLPSAALDSFFSTLILIF